MRIQLRGGVQEHLEGRHLQRVGPAILRGQMHQGADGERTLEELFTTNPAELEEKGLTPKQRLGVHLRPELDSLHPGSQR